jgi:hypothetical protein
MRAQICFFVSIVFSFVAWGTVTGRLILPELRRRGRNEALRPLLMFHSFRSSAWRSCQLGAAYFLPTFIVPLFLITHGLMFWLLLRNENEAAVPAVRRLA